MAQAADSASVLAMERSHRLRALWWSIVAAICLVGAHLLTPNPSGYGTHLRLLPIPCIWRAMTGLPCPSCGLTTAFAWMARGELMRAWQSNPLGPFVYVAAWLIVVWGVAAAAGVLSEPAKVLGKRTVLCVMLGVYIGAWLARLLAMAWP